MMMVKWLGMCLLLLPVLCVSHSSQQLPQHSPPPSYGIDEREGSKAFFNYHAGMTTPENEPIAGVGLAPNSAADRQGTAYFQRFDSEDPKARSSTSGSSSTTNSKSNVGYDEDGNTFLSGNAESGYKSEFVVGKDRELLHVSIDLKWLYRTIVNPQHWKGIARFCKDRIKRLHMGYNQLMRYREQAGNLLVSIRALEPDSCNLR